VMVLRRVRSVGCVSPVHIIWYWNPGTGVSFRFDEAGVGPGGIVPSAPGRWGWVNAPEDLDQLKYGCRTYPPRREEGTPVRERWGLTIARISTGRKNVALGPLPPRADASFHRLEDEGGGVNTVTSAKKKCGFRTSTPRQPEETGLRQKNDGGGVNDSTSTEKLDVSRVPGEKSYSARTSTPV
jgi:hypothetical protein